MTVAYLSTFKEDGKYIGGILVIDEYTIPVEFKYTDPFQPTRLQRILYGKALEAYLEHGLILKSLIKGLENRPEFMFVDNLIAVDYLEEVIFLQSAAIPGGFEEESEKIVEEEGEYILPLGKGKALRIVSKTPLDDQKLEAIRKFAVEQDILEPFQRLRTALKMILSGETD